MKYRARFLITSPTNYNLKVRKNHEKQKSQQTRN